MLALLVGCIFTPLVVVLVSLTQCELVAVLLLVSAGHEERNRTVSTSRNRESVNRDCFFSTCGRESVKDRDIVLTSRKVKLNVSTFSFYFGAQHRRIT